VDLTLGYRFLLVSLIIAVNAFFSAAEVALLSVRQSRLRQLAAEGQTGAHAALHLLENPERLLSVVQLGLTLASLALGAIGEQGIENYLEHAFSAHKGTYLWPIYQALAFAVSYLSISYIHVVIGEVVPKNLAIDKADRLAVAVAPVLLVFYRISGPFVSVIERSALWVSRMLGLKGGSQHGGHPVEELKHMVAASHRHGQITAFEEDAIQQLLDLRDLTARQIMVPRHNFAAAPADSSLDDLLRIFHEAKYSRVPVYERSPDNIIGIVNAKDLLEIWQQRRQARTRRRALPSTYDLRRMLRIPEVVPETKPVTQLIDTFRHSRTHMALVVDEFGAVTGLLTLEDVLEQVFGHIDDEHDLRLPPLPVVWETIELEGSTSIVDLEADYGIEVPPNAGFETLAGFLLWRLGVIPEAGGTVVEGDLRFTIAQMDRNRIDRVLVEKVRDAVEPPAERNPG